MIIWHLDELDKLQFIYNRRGNGPYSSAKGAVSVRKTLPAHEEACWRITTSSIMPRRAKPRERIQYHRGTILKFIRRRLEASSFSSSFVRKLR